MKKFTYYFILMFAILLISISCEKDDADSEENPTEQTLEQKYPEWKNLTWISTPVQVTNYKLDIKIAENLVTTTFTDINNNKTIYQYRDMYIEWDIVGQTNNAPIYSTTSGSVLFSWGINPADRMNCIFEIDRTEKTITLYTNPNTYKLKIN